jgi:hypothetical protein
MAGGSDARMIVCARRALEGDRQLVLTHQTKVSESQTSKDVLCSIIRLGEAAPEEHWGADVSRDEQLFYCKGRFPVRQCTRGARDIWPLQD